ncbi:UDP-glucosyltransferase 2-like [Aricia agestis]|uniref:UDP-glucosyltransferase 2-like n=1 Tax=Aricia agestis TaxID=91739 RepID=UPI001C20365E|nr:UDP-glucosyltransferase 2-like [Aricia agestis]
MARLAYIFVALLSLVYVSSAYKILFVSPLKGKSHAILAEGILKPLLKDGHEITYVCGLPPDKPLPKVTLVETTYKYQSTDKDSSFSLSEQMSKKMSIKDLTKMFGLLSNITNSVMRETSVQALINDPKQHFDVVIAEWLYTDIYASFAAIFDCPLIWLSSCEPHWKILRNVDEATNPAYTTDLFSNNIPPFSFTQRLTELGFQIMGHFIDYMYFADTEKEIYDQVVAPAIRKRGRPVPNLEDVKYNASLVLGNSHISLGMPNRLPDSYKHVGGYHIDKEVKPLPENLKKIIEGSPNGFIYFSMGSNLKSKTLPDVIKQDLVKMFGKLKQTVIWKFEEDLPNRPANLHIVQWAPQQSILAHEKCLLFITHGGLLSTTESIHFGVPIVGIPVFADQFINVARAVKKGFARRVDLSYSMVGKLHEEINVVLSDPSYRQKAKELSFIYHDRPVTPSAELVHWINHVVKTKGARHLRSPALDVAWYQKTYLDLALVLLAIVLAIVYGIKFLIISLFKSTKKPQSSKKRN